MAMPSRMPSIVTMTALVLAAAQADARRETLDAYDTAHAEFRREIDRDERQMIRELVKGWTWAAMPRIGPDDDRQTSSDDDPPRRLLRVTALAADAAGGAIVAGAVRGPMQLGATSVGMTQAQRGFIARVDRSGGFRMIQLAERETYRVPSALEIDRAGRILVSYEDHQIAAVTARGRALWSRQLPPARALAFAPDGDILAAGCSIVERLESSPFAKVRFPVTDIAAPYVARISPAGEVRWIYRLDQGQQELFYRPNDRRVEDCATGIARAPEGDVFVAGHFGRSVPPGRADEPNLPGAGSFLARFSADGRLRWSRLVAAGYGRVALASTPDGALAVVAGQVASRGNPEGPPDNGVAAFDADGVPRWSLPVRGTSPSDDRSGMRVPIGPITNIQIVAGRHRKADFVLVGTYRAGIAVGRATLSEQEGGVFLAEIDRRGSVTGLRGVPGKSRPAGAGGEVISVSLGPGAAGLWVGGTTSVFTKGAWLHAVPW